jgi:hypothetical protein
VKAPVKPAKDGITIDLYVQPGAAKTGWAGTFDGALKLRVAARPLDGAANSEVCAWLSRYFGVPKSAIHIVQGQSGRHKIVQIGGDTRALLEAAKWLIEC